MVAMYDERQRQKKSGKKKIEEVSMAENAEMSEETKKDN